MDLIMKTFEALSKRELYEILRLRSEVFIVEQGGRYQDLDGIDYDSIHIFEMDSQGCTGCVRVFLKEDEEDVCQIGRLVVKDRMHGLGKELMDAAEAVALREYSCRKLFLTGRRSARGFYEKCGYSAQVPEGYKEKDAPYFLFRKEL